MTKTAVLALGMLALVGGLTGCEDRRRIDAQREIEANEEARKQECPDLSSWGDCLRRRAATNAVNAVATAAPPPPHVVQATEFATMPAYTLSTMNIDSFCRDEWTKRGELDQRMFRYCVSQETRGHAEMLATLKKFDSKPWMSALFPAIWMEWTKRGITQYRMVGHALKQECDKFLDYEYERKQSQFNARKMDACAQEWRLHASRWSMTVHCYKND